MEYLIGYFNFKGETTKMNIFSGMFKMNINEIFLGEEYSKHMHILKYIIYSGQNVFFEFLSLIVLLIMHETEI